MESGLEHAHWAIGCFGFGFGAFRYVVEVDYQRGGKTAFTGVQAM